MAEDPGGPAALDPYSRLEYRRLIAWPQRIRREAPLIEEVLGSGPSRRVLDLGCGTGEHARYLVSRGFEVVAIDASESMLQKAREEEVPAGLRFVEGRIEELERLVDGSFGGAICLGNMLPHLTDPDGLASFFGGLRQRLEHGAALLLQILNYERIFGRKIRSLPVNVRPGEDGEIVFLRLLRLGEEGRVDFFPTSLRFDPEAEEPVQVAHSRRVRLRGWQPAEIDCALEAAGFEEREAHGGFDRRRFVPLDSYDLVLVAR